MDGESPKATGTYDKDTKKFTLDWTVLIVVVRSNSFHRGVASRRRGEGSMSETPAEETAPITTASPKRAKERVFGIAVRVFAAVTVIGSVAAITQLSYSPRVQPIVGYQIVNRDGLDSRGWRFRSGAAARPAAGGSAASPSAPSHPPGPVAAGPFGALPSVTDRGLPISVAQPAPSAGRRLVPTNRAVCLVDRRGSCRGRVSLRAFARATAYETILKMMARCWRESPRCCPGIRGDRPSSSPDFRPSWCGFWRRILPYYGP
ncbi:hypothetical protein I541_5770 [Mycobacteroides abscessus]|nr:hypothetical protein I541_5770 [Mycobacteroides abscessus]